MIHFKRNIATAILSLAILQMALAQGKFLTSDGYIRFFSHTPIEDITAENNKVSGVIDAATGEVAIIVRMTEFRFEKKLMQEHFNENYVESEKFPKATFNGTITDNQVVDYSTPGSYRVQVEGEMNIHGVTQKIQSGGTIEVTAEGIVTRAVFMLNPEDYDIRIPGVVRRNIAEEMEVTVNMTFFPI